MTRDFQTMSGTAPTREYTLRTELVAPLQTRPQPMDTYRHRLSDDMDLNMVGRFAPSSGNTSAGISAAFKKYVHDPSAEVLSRTTSSSSHASRNSFSKHAMLPPLDFSAHPRAPIPMIPVDHWTIPVRPAQTLPSKKEEISPTRADSSQSRTSSPEEQAAQHLMNMGQRVPNYGYAHVDNNVPLYAPVDNSPPAYGAPRSYAPVHSNVSSYTSQASHTSHLVSRTTHSYVGTSRISPYARPARPDVPRLRLPPIPELEGRTLPVRSSYASQLHGSQQRASYDYGSREHTSHHHTSQQHASQQHVPQAHDTPSESVDSLRPMPTPVNAVCFIGGKECDMVNMRKCISHLFGRNKSETKRIPAHAWMYSCRKHYQRKRYDASKGADYWSRQMTLLRRQLVKFGEDMGSNIMWRVQWVSELDKKVNQAMRDPPIEGLENHPDIEVRDALKLNSLLGEHCTTEHVFEFAFRMERLIAAREDPKTRNLLRVEFLPLSWTPKQQKKEDRDTSIEE